MRGLAGFAAALLVGLVIRHLPSSCDESRRRFCVQCAQRARAVWRSIILHGIWMQWKAQFPTRTRSKSRQRQPGFAGRSGSTANCLSDPSASSRQKRRLTPTRSRACNVSSTAETGTDEVARRSNDAAHAGFVMPRRRRVRPKFRQASPVQHRCLRRSMGVAPHPFPSIRFSDLGYRVPDVPRSSSSRTRSVLRLRPSNRVGPMGEQREVHPPAKGFEPRAHPWQGWAQPDFPLWIRSRPRRTAVNAASRP